MDVKCVIYLCTLEFILLLLIKEVRQQEFNKGGMNDADSGRGCEYLQCETNDVCTYRKFRCKERPCPSMLYCAKSQAELTKGPSSCDTVQCTMGYICMLKVRRCQWDNKCEKQIARCVSRKEYFEGPASCAGFKCPQGNHCILRESFCAKPPCKLLRSCAKNKEVHFWFGSCRSLGCPSEYECFLRRPENNCINPPCKHTPDCIPTRENEAANKYCLGWICPRMQTCSAETVGLCETDDCDVKRTCQDVSSAAKNDSSSAFSRRSLLKEDEVPRNDTKASVLHEIEVQGPKTPHSWMDHLNSKTELDAIELWIQNAEGQNDFKQFQDWLRSVKDILGPGAYSVWLKENLSSRGEKFRKWLQTSHDTFDVEGPISPRGGLSSTVTENPYPAWDTMNISSPYDSNEEAHTFNSSSWIENIRNSTEKLLVPNRITDPLNSILETAFLNNLAIKESNSSSPLNFLLKYPHHTGDQYLASLPPNVKNTYKLQYPEDSTKNMKESNGCTNVRYNSDLDNLREISAQNEDALLERSNSSFITPQEWNNSSLTNKEMSSLWADLHEDPVKELSPKGIYFGENSTLLSNEQKLTDKTGYPNDVPIDLLEKVVKSLYSAVNGSMTQDCEGQQINNHRQDYQPGNSRNESRKQHFQWILVKHSEDDEDISLDQSSIENGNQFSPHDQDKTNFTNDFDQIISIFLDKLSSILNDSDHPIDVHQDLPLPGPPTDDNKDAMELNLFFEQNKDVILPHVQTLMEIINEENDPSRQNSELDPDKSSKRNFFVNNANFGSVEEFPNELPFLRTEPPSSYIEEISISAKSVQESEFLKEQKCDAKCSTKNQPKQDSSNSQLQQERNSRTPGPFYTDGEPTVQTFYNLPSYGPSADVDITVHDFIDEPQNQTKNKDDSMMPSIDYANYS